ncbi:PaaI family thioesterase [Halopseudomonas sabulinigri]|uniref:PaaI family thioesterase n=1 Tax=Halopseudomonas sabulinigri TaxID=472181 RepID=A0ABP9ZRP0_9GAMM
MSNTEIPVGYQLHDRRSGLTDPWQPIYQRPHKDGLSLGLRAGQAHVNSREFVHGGLISALADNAMGLSCAARLPDIQGLVTVSMTLDYLGVARQGQWLEVRAEVLRAGGSLCYAAARIYADEQLCASASAVFKVAR